MYISRLKRDEFNKYVNDDFGVIMYISRLKQFDWVDFLDFDFGVIMYISRLKLIKGFLCKKDILVW